MGEWRFFISSLSLSISLSLSLFLSLSLSFFSLSFAFSLSPSSLKLLVPFGSQMELTVSVMGAALFSAFLVVDTQLIMRKLSTDEYILGAINLYLDILNLFLYILRILNSRK